jgi:hypothetical protein
MIRITSALITLACILPAATADELSGPFQGEWRTTVGLVKLEQKGDTVSGTYGAEG